MPDIRDASVYRSKTFTFNGVNSSEFGIQVATKPNYIIPERNYDTIDIPGRNGTLLWDTGSYANVARTYSFSLGWYEGQSTDRANAIAEWLHTSSGYCRLEDEYEPLYYRMAKVSDETELTDIYGGALQGEIIFDCKPQKFLKSGETILNLTNGQTLTNPTKFAALPVIFMQNKTNDSNTEDPSIVVKQGSKVICSAKLVPGFNYIIDSDTQNVYYENNNRNNGYEFLDGLDLFPVLYSGETTFELDTTNWDWQIKPNWWTV